MGAAFGLALCLAMHGVHEPAAFAQPTPAEESYSFSFRNADIAQVAQEIFGALGVRHTLDPSVSGRISFQIEQRMTRPQLLQAFEAALAANNIALIQTGDTILLTSAEKARSSASVRPIDEGARRAGFDVVAVPVSFGVPTEIAKALEAITGPGVVLHASDSLGLIVLGGSGVQIQSALESLRVFDQSGLEGSRIRWFELSQAPASQVAGELEEMLEMGRVAGVRVVPLKRLNGLILFGNTNAALDQVSAWIPRLDSPTRDAAASLWVYRPRNTSAEALARTLNSVSSDQVMLETAREPDQVQTGGPQSGAVGPARSATVQASSGEEQVRAAVDRETNTLLVSAPAWRWVQLQRILAEIDRPQPQVVIEATVLEVSLRNDFRLGVDWSVLSSDGRTTVSSINNDAGVIGPSFPGLSVTFIDVDVQAAIAALGTRSNVEVVSAPKIVTLDNRKARLQVGDEVPIVRQTSQSTDAGGAPVINSVDYRNSGVILDVTPRISGENRVTLQVAQEVSSVVETSTSGIDSPTIQQRKLESTLVLTDGQVVALGGLMSRSRDRGDTGVPGLKNIPGLGHLFKSSVHSVGRTELIVLLKVRIVREPADAAQALRDLTSDLREINARGMLHVPD